MRLVDGCVIEGPAVIGAGCVIEPGAEIRQCILGDYTRVSSVARLDRMLVYGNHCIEPRASTWILRRPVSVG